MTDESNDLLSHLESHREVARIFNQDATTEHASILKTQSFRTEQEVVDWLLYEFAAHMIERVRLYGVDRISNRNVLVSMTSAGHDNTFTHRFNSGDFIREFVRESESTLCFLEKCPVLLLVQPNATTTTKIGTVDGMFPVYHVPDSCSSELSNQPERMYVDIPLYLANKPFGKLSCDFGMRDCEMISSDSLRRCEILAHVAANVLANISRANKRKSVALGIRAVSKHVDVFTKRDGFENYLAKELALDQGSLNYFSVIGDIVPGADDSHHRAVLNLTRTTDVSLRPKSGYTYPFERSNYLVSIAARAKHAMRFTNLTDIEQLACQCKRYKVPVPKKNDPLFGCWEKYGAVMTNPVINPTCGSVTGLFVFTRNKSDCRNFTYAQEKTAQLLINTIFQRIPISEHFENPHRFADFACETAETFHKTNDPFASAVALLKTLLPEYGTKKLYAACGIEGANMHVAGRLYVYEGDGKLYENSATSYDPRGSITLEATRVHPRDFVYRTVGKPLRDDLSPGYTKGSVCEIACAFDHPMQDSVGAIIIKSNCFDIDPLDIGPCLRIISSFLSRWKPVTRSSDALTRLDGE